MSYCEVEYSVTPVMSEGEDENEMHFGETGVEGMDRTESIGTSDGKGENEGQIKGRKEQTSSDGSEVSCEVEEDSEETLDDEDDEMEEVNDEDAISVSKYPHLVTTLKSYNIGRSLLTIPTKFAQSNIPDDAETIVLIDDEGKEWPIKTNSSQ